MKRVIIVGIICLVMIISLSLLIGCGNKDWFDVAYTFNKAYVKIGEEWKDLEISSWTDYEGEQIQLKLKDGTIMIVSSINCILYNGELPVTATEPHWSYAQCVKDIAEEHNLTKYGFTVKEIPHNQVPTGDDEIYCFDITILTDESVRYCCFSLVSDGEVMYTDCDKWGE